MPESQRTIAGAINEYLAPEQPEDCREANKATLIAALKASGPVVHNGRTVALSSDGNDIAIGDAPEAEKAPEGAEEAPPPAPQPGPPKPAEETPLPETPAG